MSMNQNSSIQGQNDNKQNRDGNINVSVKDFAAKFKSKRGKYPGRTLTWLESKKSVSISLMKIHLFQITIDIKSIS